MGSRKNPQITPDRFPEWARSALEASGLDGVHLADHYLTLEQGRQSGLAAADGKLLDEIGAHSANVQQLLGGLLAEQQEAIEQLAEDVALLTDQVAALLSLHSAPRPSKPARRAAMRPAVKDEFEPLDDGESLDIQDEDEELLDEIARDLSEEGYGEAKHPIPPSDDEDMQIQLPQSAYDLVIDFVIEEMSHIRADDATVEKAIKMTNRQLAGFTTDGKSAPVKNKAWTTLPGRGPHGFKPVVAGNLQRLGLLPAPRVESEHGE